MTDDKSAPLRQWTVLTEFPKSRARFKELFETPAGRRVFSEVFSRKRLAHYASQDPDDRFMGQAQRQLMYVVRNMELEAQLAAMSAPGGPAYRAIADKLEQRPNGMERLLGHYCGRYRYFRYHARKYYHRMHVVEGAIEIKPGPDGEVMFEHRSQDWGVHNVNPEHTGWVFLRDSKIFMFGGRPHALRLAIIELGEDDDAKSRIFDGLVLSVRSREPHAPFSARSVLIHEENPILRSFRVRPRTRFKHELDEHCDPDEMRFLSL